MSSSRLPPPKFSSNGNKELDDNSSEVSSDGRVRTYPHVRGQWTTFVYSEVPCDSLIHLTDLIDCNENDVYLLPDVHVSLIRGHYTLSLHQITPFISSLRDRLSNCPSFDVYLSTFKLFTNDEGTRSFVCLCEPALQIDSPNTRNSQMVRKLINKTLDEFRSAVKITSPSTLSASEQQQLTKCDNSEANDFTFHTSLAWCKPEANESARKLISQLDEQIEGCIKININTIRINTGNIVHTIELKTG